MTEREALMEILAAARALTDGVVPMTRENEVPIRRLQKALENWDRTNPTLALWYVDDGERP